jgi:hypothetical protein
MRSRETYRREKRERIAKRSLGVVTRRVLADRDMLRAVRAVLDIMPTHKLAKMPSPVKKSVKHVVIPSKVFNYDANPELVSQSAKVRTIYAEASEEVAIYALTLHPDDQKMLGVQTIKSEWTQEAQLHYMWRMRQWYEWLLAAWKTAGESHLRFVMLLTTVEEFGGKPGGGVKQTKAKKNESTKGKDDAMNHLAGVSLDTLVDWEFM